MPYVLPMALMKAQNVVSFWNSDALRISCWKAFSVSAVWLVVVLRCRVVDQARIPDSSSLALGVEASQAPAVFNVLASA